MGFGLGPKEKDVISEMRNGSSQHPRLSIANRIDFIQNLSFLITMDLAKLSENVRSSICAPQDFFFLQYVIPSLQFLLVATPTVLLKFRYFH